MFPDDDSYEGKIYFSVWNEEKKEYSEPIEFGGTIDMAFTLPYIQTDFYSPIDLLAVLKMIVKDIQNETDLHG